MAALIFYPTESSTGILQVGMLYHSKTIATFQDAMQQGFNRGANSSLTTQLYSVYTIGSWIEPVESFEALAARFRSLSEQWILAASRSYQA